MRYDGYASEYLCASVFRWITADGLTLSSSTNFCLNVNGNLQPMEESLVRLAWFCVHVRPTSAFVTALSNQIWSSSRTNER